MRKSYNRFICALSTVRETQEQYLLRLLRNNDQTDYGKMYGFSGIETVRQFQSLVPITEYDDYVPYIEKISEGCDNVLTSDSVRLFEPTSGSRSGSKLVPYANSLRRDFMEGIAPWLFSLYRNRPGLLGGQAYWSISPSMDRKRTKGQIRIGFENDSEYLGFLGKKCYGKISAVPAYVAEELDINRFHHNTLLHLLAAKNLKLISVWNPTFLILLLKHFLTYREDVLRDLSDFRSGKYAKRAREIEVLVANDSSKSVFGEIFQNLDMISCWTDGACSMYADQINDYFPEVSIQGKGLIATEGFVSLPMDMYEFPVLAVNSHFFEFKDMDNQNIRLAHELEIGKRYSVIISTGGGFYRYQLKDIVEVTGFACQTPMFRFISKESGVVDNFGEKLDESHVASCIDRACIELKLKPGFFLLAPVKNPEGLMSYSVFMECDHLTSQVSQKILENLEAGLRDNYHYDYCRKLGQLGEMKFFAISSGGKECFSRIISGHGVKLGDIKPACLNGMLGWEKHFTGKFTNEMHLSESRG